MHDPIVEEVRQVRDEHAKRFGYDLDAICADLMVRQPHSGHVLVDRKIKFQQAASPTVSRATPPTRRFGALAGRARVDARFFEPLPEAELSAWEQ